MADNVKNLFFEPLKNAASSVDMNVNGSSTAVEFYITVPAGRTLQWHRTNIIIIDGSITSGLFAGIVGSPLTNGLNIKVVNSAGTTLKDFTTGFGDIKRNGQWNLLAGVDGIHQQAAGDDILPIRWTVSKAGLAPEINGGDRIVFTVQDDLSSIVFMQGMVQGYLK